MALNGYFVAAEFAAVGARASRLSGARGLMNKSAAAVKQKLDLYLSTCQLGITIASLGLGYVTEPAVVRLIEPGLLALGIDPHNTHVIAVAIGLSISTALHVVVGEVAPKNVAIFYPDRLLPWLAPPLVACTYLLYPAIWGLNSASNGLLRLSGIRIGPGAHGIVPHTADEIKGLLAQAAASGTIDAANQQLLNSAFHFAELKVRQIMTPRTEVDFVLVDQPLSDLLRIVQNSAFTRLPLCEGDIDHVVGLVHMKDLFTHLRLMPGKMRLENDKGEVVAIPSGMPGSAVHVIGSGEIDLKHIKRDVLFVPELLPLPKLLRQFQVSRVHLAIVVDEYGATQGIVTLEDVIEEIVGEIQDEFDAATPLLFAPDGENFRVSGRLPLHELRERLNLTESMLAAEGVDTVGGYVAATLGRLPRSGDTVPMGPYRARVTAVQQRRVSWVLLTPVDQQQVRADGPGVA